MHRLSSGFAENQEIVLKLTVAENDIDVPITYDLSWDTLIPENKLVSEITVTDCPQEILDCFGEREIEDMIREELKNEN